MKDISRLTMVIGGGVIGGIMESLGADVFTWQLWTVLGIYWGVWLLSGFGERW